MLPALILLQTPGAIDLSVDATRIAQGVVRVVETIPTRSGKRGFYFPKFIPGEHRPSGPINFLADLHVYAKGREIPWDRDPAELFRFVVDVPKGASSVEVRFAAVSEFRPDRAPGADAPARGGAIPEGQDNVTPNLARVKWNRLFLYPEGQPTDRVMIRPRLTPPAGWSVASALEPGVVSATELVDSPAIVGRYYKAYDVGPLFGAPVTLDVMAEGEGFQNVPEASVEKVRELVRQEGRLFGGRHFRKYRFLVTLSDAGAGEGLEHHESSEDGTGLRAGANGSWTGLLAHEMTHSWDGKYRRPEGLATPDFHKPMDGGGLWVYEGLTQYLGYVQAARVEGTGTAGLQRTFSGLARNFQNQSGRAWRPVVDTARSVGLLRNATGSWGGERRGTDYYTEGALVWLQADGIIREGTGGKRSLDDFCRRFFGGVTDRPVVKPYGTAEIVRSLKAVYPYDWARFLHERIDLVHLDTPAESLAQAGFRLVPGDAPAGPAGGRGGFGGTYLPMLGMSVGAGGAVSNLDLNGAALRAGLWPGATITKLDGAEFGLGALTAKVAQPGAGTLTFTTSRGDLTVAYVGGPLSFRLEPIPGKTDWLAAIAKPLEGGGR